LYRWRRQHPEFARAYNLAVTCWIEDLQEQCLEIADDVASSEPLERVKIRLAERNAMIGRRMRLPQASTAMPAPTLTSSSP
jgi:hypothetical protein